MDSLIGAPLDCLSLVSPEDCALAIGLPVEREDFLTRLGNRDRWDFAASLKILWNLNAEATWEQFEPEARALLRICAGVEQLGGAVRRGATLADVGSLFASYKVVAVMGHWRQENLESPGSAKVVELADGLHGSNDFVSAIPIHFSGVAHLLVCYSSKVRPMIETHCEERCQVITNQSLTTLTFRLTEYKLILQSLARVQEPYAVAAGRVRRHIQRMVDQGRKR